MITSIKEFFELIFDKSKSWGFKTSVFVSIVALLFIADFGLNLTYNIHISNKINQLEKINNLKKYYQSDSTYLYKIKTLERKIMYKRHYSEFLFFHLSRISFKSKINDQNDRNPKTTIITAKMETINIRSIFWMLVSSNYLLVLIFPVLLFLPLYDKQKITAKTLSSWLASMIFVALLILFVTWISFQIPLILNKPIYNYILNAVIHTFFWLLIIGIGNKNKN